MSWSCLENTCVEFQDATGVFSSLSQCQEVCTSSIMHDSMKFSIYPNPSSGIFNIKFNFPEPQIEILVSDIYSRLVFQATTNNNDYQLDLSNYPNGIYNLQFIGSTPTSSFKIVLN